MTWFYIIIGVVAVGIFLYIVTTLITEKEPEYKPAHHTITEEEIKNIKRKSKYEVDLLSLKAEFPSHKRILDDSVKLIQTTNNIETLLRRYDDALFHYNWINEQKKNGLPVKFECKDYFPKELNRMTNFHIVRIATNLTNNYKEQLLKLKTDKARENITIQTFKTIEICLSSLKLHTHKAEATKELNDLHDVIEDAFSNIQSK